MKSDAELERECDERTKSVAAVNQAAAALHATAKRLAAAQSELGTAKEQHEKALDAYRRVADRLWSSLVTVGQTNGVGVEPGNVDLAPPP